jgi:hypothetical protein
VKSAPLKINGREVAGIDIKGDGGFIILPPAPGRFWDPILGPDTPLTELPAWAIRENTSIVASERIQSTGSLDAYCEAILRRARKAILEAPPGTHFHTLRRVAYHVAGFCDANGMPASVALDEMERASLELAGGDPKKALRTAQAAFAAGLRRPYPSRERPR